MMSMGHWGGAARYGLPGLVAGLALAWWGGGHGPTARAQAVPPAVETNNTIAFTAASPNSSLQMLYVIDTKEKAFAVYRVDPSNIKRGGEARSGPPVSI